MLFRGKAERLLSSDQIFYSSFNSDQHRFKVYVGILAPNTIPAVMSLWSRLRRLLEIQTYKKAFSSYLIRFLLFIEILLVNEVLECVCPLNSVFLIVK